MIWGKKSPTGSVCYAWWWTQLNDGRWAWLEQIGFYWFSRGHGGCWVYYSLRGD